MRLLLARILICSAFALPLRAGDTLDIPRWSITAKPTALLNLYTPTLQLGAMYKLQPDVFLELSGGPLYLEECQSEGLYEHLVKKGWKINGEVKFKPADSWVYWGLEVYYKQFQRIEEKEIFRYARTYRQQMDLESRIRDRGVHAKIGHIFDRPGRRLFLDVHAFIGLRKKSTDLRNLPEDAEEIDRGPIFFPVDEPGEFFWPSLGLGLTLGYKL